MNSRTNFAKSIGFLTMLSLMVVLVAGLAARTESAEPAARPANNFAAASDPQQAGPDPQPVAAVAGEGDKIVWTPLVGYEYDNIILAVTGPDSFSWQREFGSAPAATFSLAAEDGTTRPDGTYHYQLQVIPRLEPEARAALAAAADSRDPAVPEQLRADGLLPPGPYVQSGSFALAGGSLAGSGSEGEEPRAPTAPDTVYHNEDVHIVGSLCLGTDCPLSPMNFGFDIMHLRANNLRILFEDTSTAANFPSNDWRLVLNSNVSGEADYFAIEDATALRQIFRVFAGAPANSLVVRSNGNIGIGTESPLRKVHIQDDDTPAVRLQQDGSAGWSPYTWDVAGNEANFFVRDVTDSSALPFRIFPGAGDSLLILRNGNVGVGIENPTERLHVDGNLLLNGLLTEASDVALKDNLAPVDGRSVLDLLAGMPLYTWNYKADDPGVRHMGPTAQDFHAAFGLGQDERHIAPLDTNGVALAGVQALHAQLEAQEAEISSLQAANQEMEARLAGLEAQLNRSATGAPAAPWLPVLAALAGLGLLAGGALVVAPRLSWGRTEGR